MFYVFYALIWLLALLPLSVLYVLSDIFAFIAYGIVRYRRKVVRRNLVASFPDMSRSEITVIERRFYRFFADLMIETIRQLHASQKEMKRRMTFENMDLLLRHAYEGRSVMLMTAHYCNWEWTSVICLHLPEYYKAYPVYQQLNNKHFDRLMYTLRSRYGAVNVEKDDLLRQMLTMRKAGVHGVFGMISDQSPMAQHIRYRMNFLNQETPVFLGTEQLSKKFNYPVYYLDIQRPRRGYYHCIIRPLCENPQDAAEHEITTAFMKILESNIQIRPELWLWSHNRWKHARQN
jgi:KDO2-lipid IV(A) lauroyltransferase